MTTLKRNLFAEQLIQTGIPLALIAVTAQMAGFEILCAMTVVMSVLSAVLMTVVYHFTIRRKLDDYVRADRMMTYYHNWALINTVSTMVGVGIGGYFFGLW